MHKWKSNDNKLLKAIKAEMKEEKESKELPWIRVFFRILKKILYLLEF